ncbi:MAG: fumarylacetoacetate hydrolase family protein [Bacteroidia bacterium]|nr:fumarylacetoacetate hydrolase family protein [Bacteroidia bacterium]
MKIICIGRNYSNHIKEMKSETPGEPVFFMKPDTALLTDGKPFYHPDFSNEIHHEAELVLKICKTGKHIDIEFANTYFDEIGIGIDFTARDLQAACKASGHPWEKAKSFDNSAPIGNFLQKNNFKNISDINFRLDINGKTIQKGNTSDLLFPFDKIISYVSGFVTLKKGDLIFTGTPEGVGPVKPGDKLEAFIEEKKMLAFEVK